jgi:hypothetical protein
MVDNRLPSQETRQAQPVEAGAPMTEEIFKARGRSTVMTAGCKRAFAEFGRIEQDARHNGSQANSKMA